MLLPQEKKVVENTIKNNKNEYNIIIILLYNIYTSALKDKLVTCKSCD